MALNIIPSPEGSLAARVANALSSKPVLLVLDNFEHLIDAAPLLPPLLMETTSLPILVTSRERLRVSGEHVFEVRPLTLPSASGDAAPEELVRSEAVQLFVERATAVRRDFSLTPVNAAAVSGICAQLDGLPLAIELAAAHINVLPPAFLLERLDQPLPLLADGNRDVPHRQRTLRSTIAWSYDLLSADEQQLFRQLSIFVGGCTFEAIEAVIPTQGVLDGVMSLVDKNLVRQQEQPVGQPRFGMLETVREFGLHGLKDSEEHDAIRLRHATHYLEFAEAGKSAAPEFGDLERANRFMLEHANLQFALRTLDHVGRTDQLLRLAIALFDFWNVQGLFEEGRRWLKTAVKRATDADPILRARAMGAAGNLAWCEGAYEEAAALYAEDLAIAQAIDDEFRIAVALAETGLLAYRMDDLDRAITVTTRAVAILRGLEKSTPGAPQLLGHVLSNLGDFAIMQGRLETAKAQFEEAILVDRSVNFTWDLYESLAGLGVVNYLQGNIELSVSRFCESLEIAIGAGGFWALSTAIFGLSSAAAALDQLERGALLLGAAEAIHSKTNAVIWPRDRKMLDSGIATLESRLTSAEIVEFKSEGARLPLEHVLAEANAILPTERRASAWSRGDAQSLGLSARELDVLRLIVQGRSDAQIGETLFISRRTVTTHTSRIFEKLGVSGRAEAAAMAVRRGLA